MSLYIYKLNYNVNFEEKTFDKRVTSLDLSERVSEKFGLTLISKKKKEKNCFIGFISVSEPLAATLFSDII